MKYTLDTIIHAPIGKVTELYTDVEGAKHWQPGFISSEVIEGSRGEAGSKNKLKFQMGKRQMEMIETIERNDMPREYVVNYEAKGVWNQVRSTFEDLGPNETKLTVENEFVFGSIMMKLVGFILPGAFKKQTQEYIDLFKAYAEKQA